MVGRFINADVLVSSQVNNANLFVYCRNNPIILGDFDGLDAVVLYDNDAVTHIGVLIQDETGEWYHFYWGAYTLLYGALSVAGPTVKVKACLDFCDFEVTNSKTTTLNLLNQSGVYSHNYEDMLYLKGDFAESYLYLESIVTYSNGEKLYSIYYNNCSQVSLYALSVSETIYSDQLDDASSLLLPAKAFKQLKKIEGRGGAIIPRAPVSIIK